MVRRPKLDHYERIIEIDRKPDEARDLVATAKNVCPEAVSIIEKALLEERRATSLLFSW